MANSVFAGIQAAAKAAQTPGPSSGGGHTGWNPGAGVSQWRSDTIAALRQLGLPQAYLLDVLYQMMTESGGNPNIVNKWDSNWAAGHPSVGLMQVIQGTFDAYAGPYINTGPFEYGVSVNPMANLYAALNYGKHGKGFGTGPGQIGSGHGYYNGGLISEPILGMGLRTGSSYSFGEFGEQEMVTPLRGGAYGGGGTNIYVQNFYLTDDMNDDAQVRRMITKVRKYKTRHGNQPTGMG
jgi:hypothetical protein